MATRHTTDRGGEIVVGEMFVVIRDQTVHFVQPDLDLCHLQKLSEVSKALNKLYKVRDSLYQRSNHCF